MLSKWNCVCFKGWSFALLHFLYSLPSPLLVSYTALDRSLPRVTCYLYLTQQKRKHQTSVVELMREGGTFPAEIRSGTSLHSAASGPQAVFLLGRRRGVCPMYLLAGLVLCLQRWESGCGSCPAQSPGFPFLEVRRGGREGAGWGRAWHLCISSLIKPGHGRAGAQGTSSTHLVWRQPGRVWPVPTLCELRYPGLVPALGLHLSCFYQQATNIMLWTVKTWNSTFAPMF